MIKSKEDALAEAAEHGTTTGPSGLPVVVCGHDKWIVDERLIAPDFVIEVLDLDNKMHSCDIFARVERQNGSGAVVSTTVSDHFLEHGYVIGQVVTVNDKYVALDLRDMLGHRREQVR